MEGYDLVAPSLDLTRLQRPASPNTALAAPAAFSPAPDIITPRYVLPASELYASMRNVADGQARTVLKVAYDDHLQAHYVVRSAIFGFPDLVTIQVTPEDTRTSNLIIWSRSVYGHSDFGVNKRRVLLWLAAMDAVLAARSKR